VDLQMSLHKARNTNRRRLVTNKILEVSNHRTGRAIISKPRRAMEETKGTSGTPHRGMLPLPTWKATKPFRTVILGASEEATKIRDKLPLVDLTRMNDPPIHLCTEVDPNRHMDASKPRKSAAPTNSKALTMSAAMESIPNAKSVMRVDMLMNPKDDDSTHIDTSTRRRVDKAMGLRLTLDLVTSIVTLGKVIHVAASGSPTRAAMTSTEGVISTVNARVVMRVGMGPLVAGTSAPTSTEEVIPTVNARVAMRVGMGPLVAGTSAPRSTEEVTPTVNARVVMGVVRMCPLVTGTSGPNLKVDMKVLRPGATEKGRGSMGAMTTATVPLVSKGSACKAVMKITQSDEDTMIV